MSERPRKSGGQRRNANQRSNRVTAAERKASRRGMRPRYVLFESDDRDALHRVYAELRAHFEEWKVKPPQILETRGSVTVLKCYHLDSGRVREVLNAVKGVRTLRTSGTLRALKRKAKLD